jgi:tetratricopeptide (TPR) repeat protein
VAPYPSLSPALAHPHPGRAATSSTLPTSPASLTHLLVALILLTCVGLTPTTAQEASFTATLDRDLIPRGDTAQLQLRFEGGQPAEFPQIPDIPGLTIRSTGRSQQTQIVNTRVSSALILTFEIRGDQTGSYVIPPIQVTVRNQILTSQPLNLTVAQTDPRIAQIAFLTLSLPRQEFYVGEAITAEMHLFFQGGEPRRAPALRGDGVTFGTNVPPAQRERIATNQAIYYRDVWRLPVTFVKTGNFQLTAEDAVLEVQFRRNGGRRDPFSLDLGSFFPSIETRQLIVNSDPVDVRVRPLPSSNVPSHFNGAVGQFTLHASLNTTNTTVGDPLTLTVRLTGSGNLDGIQWSTPPDWRGLKAYPPASRIEVADPLGLQGTRVFEQVLVPESPDVRSIPALHFSYFDPLQHAYQTLTHPGFPISVRPAASLAAQPVVTAPSPEGLTPPRTDLVHIKNRPGHLAITPVPLNSRPWFIALQLLPIAAWLAAATWRRRINRLAADPRHQRRRQVSRQLRTGLALLQQHAQHNRTQGFYSELFRLLQEQLGERLNLPSASITAEVIDLHLRPGVHDPELLHDVEQLFAHCDQARYAPQSAAAALPNILPKAEHTLRRLHSLELVTPNPHTIPPSLSLLLIGLALAPLNVAQCQSPSPANQFAEANRLYEQARYPDAIAAYQTLLDHGYSSAPLHFNLANAHFRARHTGHAIGHYLLALRLQPRDPDIQANLRFVRGTLAHNISHRPSPWTSYLTRIRLDEWSILTTTALWILGLMLVTAQWRPNLKPRLRLPTTLAATLTTSLILLTSLAWHHQQRSPLAVVIQPETPARFGPLEESPVRFHIPEGTELAVTDTDSDWIEAMDATRRVGWIHRSHLLLVP